MAEVLLFHHAQGLTPGVVAFANTLRGAGYSVHTPDLFGGSSMTSVDSLHGGDHFWASQLAITPDLLYPQKLWTSLIPVL